MKVKFKIANYNGASPIEEFKTIKEAKKWLNEMLYYCAELILNVECNYTDNWKYSKINNLRSLVSEANFYDSIICINVIYEFDLE